MTAPRPADPRQTASSPQGPGALSRLEGVLDQLGDGHRQRHEAIARRMLQENGFTVLSLDEGDAGTRPWTVDSRPYLMGQADWSVLEAGLIQRARALDLMLADLHGERKLIRQGVIPPEILSHNPHFLPAATGTQRRGAGWLWMMSVDLIHCQRDGWQVVADHTDVPQGLSYCLENRLIMARTLPLLMDLYHVRRVAAFFQNLKDHMLGSLSKESATLGLLAAPELEGQSNFEARYLAHYLGVPLIHGEDLTVRDARVYLRTIEGLHPLDGLIRFIPDRRCDPLELDPDSLDGVPGLLQSVRSGSVRLFNAIGSAALTGPALYSVLPAAARALIQEDLKLPSLPVAWTPPTGGPTRHADGVDPTRLPLDLAPWSWPSDQPRPGLEERGPSVSAAIPQPRGATGGEGLYGRPFRMRCFLARGPAGFQVLPGGLVLLDTALEQDPLGPVRAPTLRDLWIVGAKPEEEPRVGNPVRRPNPIRRSVGRVTSRVAETFYWLGRYLERVEAALRLVRAVASRAVDTTEGGLRSDFAPRLFGILASDDDIGLETTSWRIQDGEDLMAMLDTVIFDPSLNQGVQASISALIYNAERAREHLSPDMWRSLLDLDTTRRRAGDPTVESVPDGLPREDALGAVDRIIGTLSEISGAVAENMTHTLEWQFLVIGRRLERGLKLVRLWRQALGLNAAPGPALLDVLLIQADSRMTYRSRYQARPELAPALDLLLLDETNPRSLRYQVDGLVDAQAKLPTAAGAIGLRADQKITAEIGTLLAVQDAVEMVARSESLQDNGLPRVAGGPALTSLLERLAEQLPRLHFHLSETFFTHVRRPQRQAQPRTRA